MDIRRLLKASCPLARRSYASYSRHSRSGRIPPDEPSFQTSACSRSKLALTQNRGISSHQDVHTPTRRSPTCRSCRCPPELYHQQRSLFPSNRQRMTIVTSLPSASASVSVSSPLRPICRRQFNLGTRLTLQESRMFTTSSGTTQRVTRPFTPYQSKATSPSVSSRTAPDIPPLHPRIHPTSFSATNPSRSANPSYVSRTSRKRRRLTAMHQYRLQRQRKMVQRSIPRHSSQLLLLQGNTEPSMSRVSQDRRRQRLIRQSRGDPSLSRSRLGENRSQTPRYVHVHYHHADRYPLRIRFLGFQHFLRHTRIWSPHGQAAYRREKAKVLTRIAINREKARFSSRQPFVRKYRRKRNLLDWLIKSGGTQRTINLAKDLIKAKQGGAKLPDGTQLKRLVLKDQRNYLLSQHSPASSTVVSSLQLKSSSAKEVKRTLLSTMDYNMILGECEELSDWGNGYKIALTLLNRYQLPAFDFQSSADAAPNTRTIHLMLTMFLKYDHVTMARRLFSTLRGRYPHSIPLDVYASFLQELASMEGQSSRIVSFLNEMHQYGPTPTTTIYNTLLKSIGRQDGLDKAEGVLRWMKNHELEADQQSYRILMQLSLTELNLNRAHYWLAEYERQGFEINPRMLEPFMKTCIREVVSGSSKAADPGTYSREWMYNCLQLWQFMANEGMTPTPGTFDMMIEGLLSQRNLPEARKTLNLMRNCPHMYIPAPRTWTLFFDYYLQVDDYLAAMRILNEMRRAGSAAPKPKFSSGNAVPTKMYHRLFEYMLRRGKLSLAERNLYVMLIRQNRAQPTETEVVDLIWEMNGQPEDAERVYELLYSQTGDLSFDEINFKPVRTNMILQHGPIQLANVGVMRAKATSNREALHDEVRMNWRSMTKYFSEQEQRNQRNPEQAQEESPSQRKIKFLLALAFEQVARACRRTTIYDHELALAQREEAREKEEAEEEARNGWDFNRSRRSLGLSVSGLGLGLGRPGASAVSSARPLEFFKSKHRMLIQQLLKNQAFLQPLVSRRNNNNDSSKTTMFSVVSMEERLKDLKSSFEWVQEHKIPIRTDGFNAYLESLISHRDFDTARDTIERFLLHPSSLPHIDHALGNKKDRLRPDLGTIKILNVNKGILFEGKELMDQTLRAGGPWLSREWEQYLQSCHPRGPNHTRTSFKTEMRAKYRTPLPSSVDSSAITQGTPSSCSM